MPSIRSRCSAFLSLRIAGGLLLSASLTCGYEPVITGFTASSTLSGWQLANAFDGDNQTVWSTVVYGNANVSHFIEFSFANPTNINYVRLTPRFHPTDGYAMCFPVSFEIASSNGFQWVTQRTVSGMQRPYRNADILLPFPTVTCNAVKVTAKVLGDDNSTNHLFAFQLAEVRAGYEPDFANRMIWSGNNAGAGVVEFQNVGARDFNPTRLANWRYDERNPVLQASTGIHRNIYAPFPVAAGNDTWNVYFGGWDGSSTPNDTISMTVTTNRFATFGPHRKLIASGDFTHANNESVVRVSSTDWRMAYTTGSGLTNQLAKPGYATSTNGLDWTPTAGSTNYLMTMSGYAGWTNADLNGVNSLYYDGSLFHLYFSDMKKYYAGEGVQHAFSSDGWNFTYQQRVLDAPVIVNDVRKFTHDGKDVFIWGYLFADYDWSHISYSLGSSLTNAGTNVATIFRSHGTNDSYMISCGFVQDENRLIGCLYGASYTSGFIPSQIFAQWLQRGVVFTNSFVRWGDTAQAVGPDRLHLNMSTNLNVETGQFEIYAEDGVTLEYRSPLLTILPGDVWQLIDPLVIEGARMVDQTRFEITLSGPGGRSYRLLAATNAARPLNEWTQLTNGIFRTGSIPFSDSQVANYPSRFYRVVSP